MTNCPICGAPDNERGCPDGCNAAVSEIEQVCEWLRSFTSQDYHDIAAALERGVHRYDGTDLRKMLGD